MHISSLSNGMIHYPSLYPTPLSSYNVRCTSDHIYDITYQIGGESIENYLTFFFKKSQLKISINLCLTC